MKGQLWEQLQSAFSQEAAALREMANGKRVAQKRLDKLRAASEELETAYQNYLKLN